MEVETCVGSRERGSRTPLPSVIARKLEAEALMGSRGGGRVRRYGLNMYVGWSPNSSRIEEVVASGGRRTKGWYVQRKGRTISKNALSRMNATSQAYVNVQKRLTCSDAFTKFRATPPTPLELCYAFRIQYSGNH